MNCVAYSVLLCKHSLVSWKQKMPQELIKPSSVFRSFTPTHPVTWNISIGCASTDKHVTVFAAPGGRHGSRPVDLCHPILSSQKLSCTPRQLCENISPLRKAFIICFNPPTLLMRTPISEEMNGFPEHHRVSASASKTL